MSIDHQDTENLRRIVITERLDITGTDAIAIKFAALAASAQRRVVVDISTVTFLASIGIRALLTNAKAQQARGGRLVLFVGDNASIIKTLETTGVDILVPIFTDALAAEKAALE